MGDKCTYADIAFVIWQKSIANVVPREEGERVHLEAWLKRICETEGVKRVLETQEANMKRFMKQKQGEKAKET